MLDEIITDAEKKMDKSIESLKSALNRVRTGRAHPSLLDPVMVPYFDTPTPINQLANIGVEEGRTLTISPWEKPLIPVIEKAIMAANLGFNPSSTGELIRVPLPPLTEESRKELSKVVRSEGENAKISVRSVRREANSNFKELLKEKEISEDDARKGEDQIQKLTDKTVGKIDEILVEKEKDIMTI